MRIRNFLATLFVLLMLSQSAWAALSANTVWEVRTTGSDTNGGGFVPAVTAISSKTDLVVNASNNYQVSSSGYGFTSADVGRWLKVTAGTGWTVGLYYISAVATGTATLTNGIGGSNASPAAVSTTGGSFTVYYGLDYSQQNAANSVGSNISTTDLVTAGSTTIVSATATFTADIVGNVVYIAGGTGSITGAWYEITAYTNATTVTVDRSTGLTTGTGATLNIGGAIADLSTLSGIYVSGNKAFIKATGTYVQTAGVTFSQGTNTLGWISGYSATRGDGGHATIQGSTNTGLTLLTTSGFLGIPLYNLTFDCNSLGTCTGVSVATSGTIQNCKVMNYTSYGIYASGSGGEGIIANNEVTSGSGTPTAGIYVASTSGNVYATPIYGNYVHDGVGPGIYTGTRSATVANNVVANMSGATSDGIILVGYQTMVYGNTVYNSGRDGIRGNSDLFVALNNILVSNGGYGLNSTSASFPASPLTDGNAFYNNASGNLNDMNDTGSGAAVNGVNPYLYTKNVFLSGTPFVNAGSGNFALNNTSGAGAAVKGTGLPSSWPGLSGTTGYPSFGAVQPNTTTMGGGVCVSGQ